jgi:sugar diacid utilization regulator
MESTMVFEDTNKKILTTSAAFGVLRKGLIKNLGTRRATGFLLRYGWSLGVGDAEEAMKISTSIDFLIKQAAVLHSSTGQIGEMQSERIIEMDDSGKIKSIHAKGKWINSFEANEHLRHHGKSDTPVCHTLTGYATGYMTTICQKPVFIKEIACIAMGDPECCFEMRLYEDWGTEIQDHLQLYHEMNIIEELEDTYEQLLEKSNYIEKLSTFHKKLTDSVSSGSNLKDIADTTFKLLRVPVAIEDLSFQKITFSGIAEEEYLHLNQDLKTNLIKKNRNKSSRLPVFQETTRLKTGHQERLITPIIVQKKIIGYFTFLYAKDGVDFSENDIMFIERAANAASLYLLNEKASFEAIEKMKGYFLEQILKGQYSSKEEIIKRGRFMGFDFDAPFHIAAFDFTGKEAHSDQLLETIAKYLDIIGHKALIGLYDGRVIMYIPSNTNLLADMDKILKHIENTDPSRQYKVGISDECDNIEAVLEYVDEALIALRMSTERKMIFFAELGIVGVLINSKNINGIKKIAKQELGPLYKLNDAKMLELMKTLYVFLKNGGKLHKTMEDLALSMSGLMYRIGKIEKLLKKDLRDPSQSYQLLLILDSLLAMGELEI